MPNSKPFPSRESDLNNYFQNATAHLSNVENAKRLGVSDANIAILKVNTESWNKFYPLTQNPDLVTKTIRENKDI